MNAIPIIEVSHRGLVSRAAIFQAPAAKWLNKAQEWEREIGFIREECTFFSRIILQSNQLSTGVHKDELFQLLSQVFHFRDNDLSVCSRKIQVHLQGLKEQSNCKYPPACFEDSYDLHRQLDQQLTELNAVWKGLKIKAFSAIGRFFTIRIF